MKTKYYIMGFLYKAFAPFSSNSKILQEAYLHPITEASRSNCYVENTGNKADSLHRRIKQTYEEDIKRAYLRTITSIIKSMHLGPVMLAFDFTDEDFYGYTSDIWLHPWTGEEGVNATYTFAVLSLVGRHKIPILAVPVHIGMNKAELVEMFIKIAKKLFKRINCILLDAGFYSGEVIEALQGEKYLIRAPKNEAVVRYIEDTKKDKWKVFDHEIKWRGNKSTYKTKTKIVIVRNVLLRKKYVDCSYATNMQLQDGMSYVHLYCKRWQIETNFRMEDQVRIKSKSLFIIVRYFYFMISLLLHALWLFFWRDKIAFDEYKIHLANQFLFESLELNYYNSVA